jgi:BASS family bile acid:Na+ symporter
MEALKQIIPLLLTLSLAGLVVTVGLNSTRQDLLYVLARPKLLLKAIVAVDLIPPAAAILLTLFLPIEPVVKAGIVLMAIAPVPPLVPGQELGVGARKEYAYGVYVAMALLTVIAVPLWFWAASRAFGRQDSVSVMTMAQTILTGVLIPLAIGMAVRRLAPALAARAASWVYRLSMLLVLMAFLPIIIQIWPAIRQIVGNGTLASMGAVVVVSLLGGHLLGGPDRVDRGTLATASAVRHPGIAMMLANANFGDPRITAAVLLFMLVGLILGLPYKQWIKRTSQTVKTPGVARV